MKWIIKNKYDLMSALNVLGELSIDSDHILELKKSRGKRTLDQNSLMWVWCSLIEKETGQSREDVYYEMEDRFSPTKTYNTYGGGIGFRKQRLKELETKDYSIVLQEMKDFWQTKFNIELLWPDDMRFDLFYEEAT